MPILPNDIEELGAHALKLDQRLAEAQIALKQIAVKCNSGEWDSYDATNVAERVLNKQVPGWYKDAA